jgi:hypothetical protein
MPAHQWQGCHHNKGKDASLTTSGKGNNACMHTHANGDGDGSGDNNGNGNGDSDSNCNGNGDSKGDRHSVGNGNGKGNIRSAKQDDIYGASNIFLPCPSS